jgi:hypothetical protein
MVAGYALLAIAAGALMFAMASSWSLGLLAAMLARSAAVLIAGIVRYATTRGGR